MKTNISVGGIIQNSTEANADQIAIALVQLLNATLASGGGDSNCSVVFWRALDSVLPLMDRNGLVFVFHTGIPVYDDLGQVFRAYDIIQEKQINVSSTVVAYVIVIHFS